MIPHAVMVCPTVVTLASAVKMRRNVFFNGEQECCCNASRLRMDFPAISRDEAKSERSMNEGRTREIV
jgi:hypothetical protein